MQQSPRKPLYQRLLDNYDSDGLKPKEEYLSELDKIITQIEIAKSIITYRQPEFKLLLPHKEATIDDIMDKVIPSPEQFVRDWGKPQGLVSPKSLSNFKLNN